MLYPFCIFEEYPLARKTGAGKYAVGKNPKERFKPAREETKFRNKIQYDTEKCRGEHRVIIHDNKTNMLGNTTPSYRI